MSFLLNNICISSNVNSQRLYHEDYHCRMKVQGPGNISQHISKLNFTVFSFFPSIVCYPVVHIDVMNKINTS